MIKILFLIHDLGSGGAEKVLVNLVNNMNRNLFDITVIALFGGGVNEQFLSPDIKYKVIYNKLFPGNSQIMKLFSAEVLHRAYIHERYDIEVSYLEGPSARIISGCKDPSTKLMTWIHVEQHNKKVASKAFRSFRESVFCYSRFDAVAAVSEAVRRDFHSIYSELSNICVLYNTIETDKILKLKDEEVTDAVFSEEDFKICGVGKIVPAKGFMTLARVHKRLVDQGFHIHTYLLGEGSEKKTLERFVRDSNLENSFTFLGYQTNPYKYVSKCDVFVCASSAEGFSTAASEAVIVNTPVITTPVSGMEELLGEDPCGVICGDSEEDLYQELKRWICNLSVKEAYKEKTKARAEKFSKTRTVEDVEAFFLSLLQ